LNVCDSNYSRPITFGSHSVKTYSVQFDLIRISIHLHVIDSLPSPALYMSYSTRREGAL
jgi:hypothetical protein